jgi:hypothetical protein
MIKIVKKIKKYALNLEIFNCFCMIFFVLTLNKWILNMI